MLLAFQFSFSQVKSKATTTYTYGHNGIQLIYTGSNETVVVSTFNSKYGIKEEIAQKVYDQFKNKCLCSGDILTILGKDAKVTGKFEIKQKGKLTSINFYYQLVEWNSGLTEVYKKV